MSVLPRQKQSSWAPQEGPEELQAGQDQAKPGSELRELPSKVPTAQEAMQQQGSEKETEDPQERQQNPGTVEGQASDSCQVPVCREVPVWAGGHGEADSQGCQRRPAPVSPILVHGCLLLFALEISSMQPVWVTGIFCIVFDCPQQAFKTCFQRYVNGVRGRGAVCVCVWDSDTIKIGACWV